MLGYIILTTGWLSFKARGDQGGADGAYKAGRVTRKGVEGGGCILEGRSQGKEKVARKEETLEESAEKEGRNDNTN